MANSYIETTPGTGGPKLDTETVTVAGTDVRRERMQITGAADVEIARIQATAPAGTEQALVTRNIPSGTQPVSGPLTDAQLRATPVPITGTITASDASVGLTGAAVPASSQQNGGPDAGGLLRAHRVYDLDSGAGTEFGLGVSLRKTASGGSVEAGTSTDPLRVDPTGTTTQPVSAAALPLPSGAATESTLATRLAEATFTTRIPVQGQAAMAASVPVVIASNQSAVPISAASLPLPTGAATQATLATLLLDATFTGRTPSALVGGRFDVNAGAWLGSTAPTVGQKTSANSIPVVLPSDTAPTTEATTSVSSSASNVTLLAANSARKEASFYNDSTSAARIKCGAGASSTSFKIRMLPFSYYELPLGPNGQPYTGIIDAIWESANGSMRIGETT